MDTRITLAHGAGGQAMRHLIETLIAPALQLDPDTLRHDQARLPPPPPGHRIALTSDAYVVQPRRFPGGDIGRLAVAGTVNDLAVGGAHPTHLSCSLIIEEGLPTDELRHHLHSMAHTAREAGVTLATGDTKVVPRGAADGLYITTTGIGHIPPAHQHLDPGAIRPGDALIVTGPIGRHGAAIACARADLHLDSPIHSDCRPLNHLIAALLQAVPDTRCLRDATRGGLAAVLDEFAQHARCTLEIDETRLPIDPAVAALEDLLGLDPLHLANEGTCLIVVPAQRLPTALDALRSHPHGRHAAHIGHARPGHARALLRTPLGSHRLIHPPHGELLPRIC